MYQSLTLVGNVGKEPEMRYTPSGQAVCAFSLATNNEYTNQSGEHVKETTWFRVTTWGKQAEVMGLYVTKGMKVLVEGRLTPDKATGGPRIWTDKEGNAKASFEVTAQIVKFLSGGKGEAKQSETVTEADEGLPY